MPPAVFEAEKLADPAAGGRVAGVVLPVRDDDQNRASYSNLTRSSDSEHSRAQTLLAQRKTQLAWAALPISERIALLRRTRFALAAMGEALAQTMPTELARTAADTLVAEVLPLLAACKFLEREAAKILAVRRLGRRGLPTWLTGTDSEVQRVPMGTVLVIGPSNYPLFLPGVQALQALVAGNAVIWKPGRGGKLIAELFAKTMFEAGLPCDLLQVTDDTVEASETALRGKVDKVIFTGSADNGRAVLRAAAERLIPCVIEASGCDAVIVLPTANLERVVKALTFGLRLNGSATCMAPRRLFVLGDRTQEIVAQLTKALEAVPALTVAPTTWERVMELLVKAEEAGANVIGELDGSDMRPLLVTNATPSMEIARTDVFAPVLSVIAVKDIAGVLAAEESCPFGLTAAIFGEEREARALAGQLEVGTVLINDLIVSTADPRVPFGGRRLSGFGVTRGAEGLLEMTAAKVVSSRRGKTTQQYEATGGIHGSMFNGVIRATYAQGWSARWQGLKQMVLAGKNLGKK